MARLERNARTRATSADDITLDGGKRVQLKLFEGLHRMLKQQVLSTFHYYLPVIGRFTYRIRRRRRRDGL
ncbi:hypothetical protein KIN20_011044 [Parelaphostrongylus tenuis]|uniref:Uncharacterized protein n=1 Tax=Parelaphostrongylus tenuis TaxID=148309 RepID=A0AAD5M8T6_PARTN|nr:hypothetical protein KIN20_011044 [Parelaphostrongylus tenuis]